MSSSKLIKILLYIFLAVILIIGIKGYDMYHKAFAPNVNITNGEDITFYIHTGDSIDDIMCEINELNILKSKSTFKWTIKKKNYANNIKPGKYTIKHRMSNNELVNLLRSGRQTPVNLTFNNIRTLDQFAERISDQLELSSSELLEYINDPEVQNRFGFNKYTINCMFIPNTYEFYWNTSVEQFVNRMHNEYNNFWNKKRTYRLKSINMSKVEVITLASIVNEETTKSEEKTTIAGVYLNRLEKGIRLQADPTVIYAVGDFNIRRVLKKHYKIDSPFNTYRNDGLPPGPICLPEISSIDAVLNYEKHKYLYFCAKPDFSGYHNFARTLKEHNRNAEVYRRELNKRRIYR